MAVDERLSNGNGDRETVARACAACQFVDDGNAVGVDVPQDEGCFLHLSCKCGHIGLDAVIHRNSCEELAVNGKGGILCGNEATNLGHDCHKGDRADVCAFPAHVAACDDLKSSLLCRINIVRDKYGRLDFLLNWVATGLNGKGIFQFRPDIVLTCGQLSER